MGSVKRQLVFQFLTESVLLTLFAMLCAYVLMLAVLPYFNQLSDKNVSVEFFFDYRLLMLLFAVSLTAGVLAGIYPAFFLSSFNTIKVLKVQPHRAHRRSRCAAA